MMSKVYMTESIGSKGAHLFMMSTDVTIENSRFTKGNGQKYVANFENTAMGAIIDSIFEDNYSSEYGGAVAIQNANFFSITSTNFTSNICDSFGGAIWANHVDSMHISSSFFQENSAFANGGAVYIDATNLSLTNSIFRGNYAKYNGGSLALNFNTFFNSMNNLYTENEADSGGAIYAVGGFLSSCNYFVMYDITI